MDNAFRMLSELVSNLTSVIVGILGLGIVGSLAFGDMMGLDVIGNITSLVEIGRSDFTIAFQVSNPLVILIWLFTIMLICNFLLQYIPPLNLIHKL